MLLAGIDPAKATDIPPEGFVRLAPTPPPLTGGHVARARPAGGTVFALAAMVTAGLAAVQTLIPWRPWLVAMQASGVLVMFSILGVWVRLNQSAESGGPLCSCERPPVWIRVVPSMAEPWSAKDRKFMEPARADAAESLVGIHSR
jgi:hypothetical protein